MSKFTRAHKYIAKVIGHAGKKPEEDYSFAYRQRHESEHFALAEIYAEAAGKAAAIVEEIGDGRAASFHASLMAQSSLMIKEWEGYEKA